MITTIVVLAYVASVFYARWVNKKAYEADNYNPVWPWAWFIPLVNLLFYSLIFFQEVAPLKIYRPRWLSWFIGDRW